HPARRDPREQAGPGGIDRTSRARVRLSRGRRRRGRRARRAGGRLRCGLRHPPTGAGVSARSAALPPAAHRHRGAGEASLHAQVRRPGRVALAGGAAAMTAGDGARQPDDALRLLHVIPTLGVGGTERQLVNLLPRLDPRRFRQTVCHYTACASLEDRLEAAGIRTVFIDKQSVPPWTFLSRLRRVVREVRPDVVHTWLYSGNFWGRVAAISCGVRHLVASDRAMVDRAPLPVVLYERMLAPCT